MIIKKLDGSVEKTILTAMITKTEVLGRLVGKWNKEGLFKSTWANIVGKWCIKYYQKYEKAPGRAIENLFVKWAENKEADKETIQSVEKLLSNLSGEYSKLKQSVNTDFILDLAGDYFNRVKIEKLTSLLEADLDTGKLEDAWKRIVNTNKVEVGVGAGINVLQDATAMWDAVQDAKKSVLVKFPGALGQFFGTSLERDGFVSFLGPEKRGKTFWLMHIAWQAMLQKRKVAFFEVGDLSEKQILRRFATRALKRPLKPTRSDRPVKYPKQFVAEGDVTTVIPEIRTYDDWVTKEQVIKACQKVMGKVGNKDPYLKVSVHPTSSISVAGIRSVLKEWEAQQWVPDLVVIDYADILAAPTGFNGESRDAVNETWKALRRMSQELHCLVVTATQANAASYTADMLGMQNFSEDKRKFSHVTAMIGINQNAAEKENQVQKLNWLVLREDEFSVKSYCLVAGCLAIANPAIKSLAPPD